MTSVRRGTLAGLLESIAAVLIAGVCGATVLLVTGHDAVAAFSVLGERLFLRATGISEALVRAAPLLLAGAAVLVAVRAGVWNIGIDGQAVAGALTAAVVAAELAGRMPAPLMWLTAGAAALLAGALWALVPALLRAWLGLNEIITTIMLNYVALSLASWLVKGPLRDPALVAPQTPLIPRADRLPVLGDSRLHLGVLIASAIALGLGYVLHATRFGFELSVAGERPRVARYAVLPVRRLLLTAFLLSGALAGLAGANDVLATRGTFQADWNPGYGLAAFALVFLAHRRAVGLLPAALLLGALAYGADVLPRAAGVAPAFFDLLEGLMLAVLALAAVRPRRARAYTEPSAVPLPVPGTGT